MAATAACGIVAGHLLDYALVVSDPDHRSALLARTGHGYMTRITTLAVWIAVVAGCAAIAMGIARARRGAGGGFGMGAVAAVALAQAGGFIGVEAAERLASGIPLHHMADVVVTAGVGLQLIVGALAALALVLFERIGRRVGSFTKRRAPVRPRVVIAWPGRVAVRSARLNGPRPIRGPPLLLRP